MQTAQDYLRAIREKGLTQVEIADRTGIPQGTVSKIERGEVKDVLSKTYLALRALHDELYPPSPWDGKERRKGSRRSTDCMPGRSS